MHILLLTALVLSGLIWGIVNLQREMRRRAWEKKNITPLYTIDEPRDLVATLAFAVLKCGGDLTTEQKEQLLRLYVAELKYSENEAAEMYSYASYLLSTDPNYAEKAKEICAPANGKFSDAQRESALNLLHDLVKGKTESQDRFLSTIRLALVKR